MIMSKYARMAAFAAVTTVLSGCNTTGSRPCDAFGLPLADVWSTRLSVGDTATYVNQFGATKTLVLSSRVDSEPYEGVDRFGAEEVTCIMTSARRYIVEEDNTAMLLTHNQIEGFEDTDDEQYLAINIDIESPPETSSGYQYVMVISDAVNSHEAEFTNENPSLGIPRDTRHVVNFSNSINDYPLAVEQLYLYHDAIPNQDSPAAISRVVLAENGGLVQFETLSGDVFSRMDTEQ